MANRVFPLFLALAIPAVLACGPRRPPAPPARPSLDPSASPAGTPDPRAKSLEVAKTEPDPVVRAEKLLAIADGAPPSDHLARTARVAAVRALAQAGRLPEMRRAAGELEIADDSEGADLLNVMAYAYAEDGKHLDRAHKYSQRALEVVLSLPRPEALSVDTWKRQIAAVIAAYRDTLGWILFKGGDLRGAVREISQASQVLPEDPTIHWHLGQALLAAGKHAEGIDALVTSAVGDGEESAAARALALGSAGKAGLSVAEVEAKLSAARSALEQRVRVAVAARKLDEEPRELTVLDASGAPVRIRPGDGRPVVLLFWGAFSAPSTRALRMVGAAVGPKARLLTVSLDRDPATANREAKEAGISALPGLDPDGTDAEAFAVRGLPTALVLDAHGRVRYRNEGVVPGYEIQLKAQLESLGD